MKKKLIQLIKNRTLQTILLLIAVFGGFPLIFACILYFSSSNGDEIQKQHDLAWKKNQEKIIFEQEEKAFEKHANGTSTK